VKESLTTRLLLIKIFNVP